MSWGALRNAKSTLHLAHFGESEAVRACVPACDLSSDLSSDPAESVLRAIREQLCVLASHSQIECAPLRFSRTVASALRQQLVANKIRAKAYHYH